MVVDYALLSCRVHSPDFIHRPHHHHHPPQHNHRIITLSFKPFLWLQIKWVHVLLIKCNKFKQQLANFVQLPCDTLFSRCCCRPISVAIQFQNLIARKLTRSQSVSHPTKDDAIRAAQTQVRQLKNLQHNTRLIFQLLINTRTPSLGTIRRP